MLLLSIVEREHRVSSQKKQTPAEAREGAVAAGAERRATTNERITTLKKNVESEISSRERLVSLSEKNFTQLEALVVIHQQIGPKMVQLIDKIDCYLDDEREKNAKRPRVALE